MTFEIEIEGLDRLRGAIQRSPDTVYKELSGAIKTSVNFIRPLMRREVPVKSGKLSRNIEARADGLEGSVGPNLQVTPYAIYVHEGTRPHIIRPRTMKALYWKGAAHPWKVIHHPGTKANPFVERTFNEVLSPVQQIFQSAVGRIIQEINN